MTPLASLYAILDIDAATAAGHDPLAVADAWLDAGVRLFQMRAKHLPGGAVFDLACTLADRARAAGATFVVNDRVDVAHLSGATGVHLGQTDLTPADARLLLGDSGVVGLSTHNAAQIDLAVAAPVDYVAVGPVYGTLSKANPDPVVGLALIAVASETLRARRMPVVAIGGITLERAPAVLEAGADSVAVISDLLIGDPGARARAYLRALRGS